MHSVRWQYSTEGTTKGRGKIQGRSIRSSYVAYFVLWRCWVSAPLQNSGTLVSHGYDIELGRYSLTLTAASRAYLMEPHW